MPIYQVCLKVKSFPLFSLTTCCCSFPPGVRFVCQLFSCIFFTRAGQLFRFSRICNMGIESLILLTRWRVSVVPSTVMPLARLRFSRYRLWHRRRPTPARNPFPGLWVERGPGHRPSPTACPWGSFLRTPPHPRPPAGNKPQRVLSPTTMGRAIGGKSV